MRVGERRATNRKSIDVWRLRKPMATEMANPVVLVIDGDEKNVRSWRGGRRGKNSDAPRARKDRKKDWFWHETLIASE